MYAFLMPELDNFICNLMQFRAWDSAQNQYIYRQRNEHVLGAQRCRSTVISAFPGRGHFFGNKRQVINRKAPDALRSRIFFKYTQLLKYFFFSNNLSVIMIAVCWSLRIAFSH